MFTYKSSSLAIVAAVLVLNVGLSHAMLPPPMLRAVCGAFADAGELVENKAMAAGKAAVDLAMKPIAIVGGLKAAAVGTGMKIGGGAIKFVGAKMAKDGAILEASGAGVKGAGLGVAALGVKPFAEKIVAAGQTAQTSVDTANKAAQKLANGIGDTSLLIETTFDSPILGHHHKEVNVTGGLGTAIRQHGGLENEQQQIEQAPVQQENTIVKRAAKVDSEVMKSALNLVKEAKMEDCVARAICDLNCNPQGFGQDGKQVFMNMVRLQGSNILDESESKYFREAATKGRQNSGKCDQCSNIYAKCSSKSTDLIKLASHLRAD